MLEHRIQQHFIDSADLKYQAAQALGAPIAAAVHAMVASLTGGAKVLACGSGTCAALAQQFAVMCVAGFERERPGLAALALAPDASWMSAGTDGSAAQGALLARHVHALGHAGDVLLLLATSGNEPALLDAVRAAHEREMTVVALAGRDGGSLAALLRETDVLITIPHERAARVREMQVLVLHCLCDGMDAQLLGDQEVMP
ncbi:SIS domain-containing protein [Melaminivora sp.]|uniref:SIS domain-containing protein n=1 Tax=Melaminivora sp. TaxID=1933032 RepID=UPI0028AEEEAA|nr:SIS domain-containing protein [Melaminivora sp.]